MLWQVVTTYLLAFLISGQSGACGYYAQMENRQARS